MKKLEKILFHLPENLVIIFITIAVGLLILVACQPAVNPNDPATFSQPATVEGKSCILEIKDGEIIHSYLADNWTMNGSFLRVFTGKVDHLYSGNASIAIVHTNSCMDARTFYQNGN